MNTSKHLKTRNGKVKIEALAGHITTNAGQDLAQVNDAPVLNQSAAREEVELTTRITSETENRIKDATINNLPTAGFKES